MREIDVQTLKQALDADELEVVDVRESWELEQCRIDPCTHLPMTELGSRFADELDPRRRYAILCHHGSRSAQVTRFLAAKGFEHVSNVTGGIDAWARHVDPEMPRY